VRHLEAQPDNSALRITARQAWLVQLEALVEL
jgi:hypothetical protein